MIRSKQELRYYMEEGRKAFHKPEKLPWRKRIAGLFFRDCNYEYMKCLRKLEYYTNVGGGTQVLLCPQAGALAV